MRIDMTHEGLFIDGQNVTEKQFQQMCREAGFTMMTDSEQNEMDSLRRENATLQRELERARMMYNHLASKSVAPDMLKRYCDNARAYGWEIGFRQIDPCAQVTTSRQNPFVKPDWDAEILEEANAFIVTARDVPL